MDPKDTLSSCSYSDEKVMQQMLKRAKILKGGFLNGLSALKSNFIRKLEQGITKSDFERAFLHIFGEDVDTFTSTFSQNMNTLKQQLTKETTLEKDFHTYTGMEPQLFKEIILKNFDFIKNYMLKTIIHVQTIQQMLDDKELQIQECTVQEVKASDAISEDKAQERWMVSFRLLHSHLKLLSNNDLKGTRAKYGFKRAFATLFGQDLETFTSTMFLNVDQLEKQLGNKKFQEIGSMAAFKYTNSRSGNDAHVDDADIRPIYDEDQWMSVENELRKLTGNSVNTKFANSSILGKTVLQQHRNQSVVRQLTAFKSERPRILKPRFATQVDVNNDLSKPVTTHYLPKEREVASAKPHHVIASSNFRNSSKNMPRFSSNDMVHNHYLEEAKKKT
uniref:Uncharacterized protein n=1 Tax=Tanacetum cinerariifolium TaxID=118510 RepID=A0A699I047_TANCI|nr:hypothetical protein [Tanacetum cinerariifolium]